MDGFDVKDLRVYGLDESVVASGFPMMLKAKELNEGSNKDYTRAKKLAGVPIGSGHDNFLNGIIVQMTLTLPEKVWPEMQRYHFLDFVSSCSTVHAAAKIVDMPAEEKAGMFDRYTSGAAIDVMEILAQHYKEQPTEENHMRLLMSIPSGLMLGARVTTNYRQLKTIYWQRKDHPIYVWRNLCQWMEEELPMFKKLCCEKEGQA